MKRGRLEFSHLKWGVSMFRLRFPPLLGCILAVYVCASNRSMSRCNLGELKVG